jgi:hypothetical protein
VTLTTPMVITATARLTWQALGADGAACAMLRGACGMLSRERLQDAKTAGFGEGLHA